MEYIVVSFTGDYPVENQPNWAKTFSTKEKAIEAARAQHKKMKHEYTKLYTVVMEKDNSDVAEWIIYYNDEINDRERATKLANELANYPI